MEPPSPTSPPGPARRLPCLGHAGPLGGYAAAADARLLAAMSDQAVIAWARTQERLDSARETLSRSTELIAHSNDALARSATLLAPEPAPEPAPGPAPAGASGA